MKKTLSLVVAALTLAASSAYAQKDFALKGGIGISTITESTGFPGADVTSLLGFTFGFSYQIAVNEQFYIQPELNFVKKGAKLDLDITEDLTSIKGTINLGIDYLEVPVLAKVYLGETDTKFYLIGGPSLGYGIGGKAKYDLTIKDPDLGEFSDSGNLSIHFGDSDSESGVTVQNRVDFGFYFGAGVRVGDKFIFDARYNLGLSNLSGESDDDSKHRGFQFTVAIPFAVNK